MFNMSLEATVWYVMYLKSNSYSFHVSQHYSFFNLTTVLDQYQVCTDLFLLSTSVKM